MVASNMPSNMHSNIRMGFRWFVLGCVSLTLPIVPPSAATIVSPPPAKSFCSGAQTLALDHPDRRTFQDLLQRYNLEAPFGLNLENPNLSQFEFGQLLQWLLQRPTDFKPADRDRIVRLLEKYQPHNAMNDRRYKGMTPRVGMPAPHAYSIAPVPMPASTIAPPAAGRLPQTTAKPAPLLQEQRMPSGTMLPPAEPQSDEPWRKPQQPGNTESYQVIDENPFQRPQQTPLSTFSIDVDTASYSNVRRMIASGSLPPKDAVRLEEMINYFPYRYSPPKNDQPFSVNTAVAAAPWNPQHRLVRIGLQGQQLETPPPSNLVFLLDVSGSMESPEKLPLVKQSMCLLVQQLSAQDRVSIVVYAGSSGLVLPPTPGNEKQKIMAAIDNLSAGGSTAGGEGIELAYKQAQQAFIKGANNRVILATDGDFNVGPSSDAELVRLIESKRDQGIFLSVLGFGTGNYKDDKMEQLADKGNGNYAYIDTLNEARKVLVTDLRGTLFTIAKDVKVQVEFNPSQVQAYRLIGYENRALRDQDFNDDRKDAGEIGAGHRVTALYEVVPTGIASDLKIPDVDPLKYQPVTDTVTPRITSDELMQVKLRYKAPTGNKSQLITQTIAPQITTADPDLQFAAAVALFGMILRNSEYKGKANLNDVFRLAQAGLDADKEQYRQEFVQLVKQYQRLKQVAKTDSLPADRVEP
jgi:Ca-activated chloride channel family protein